MRRLSPRVRITIGLLGLLVSVMLLALVLRIVPDRDEAVLQGRSRLCEAIAVNTSVLVSRDDVKRLQAILTVLVKRHDDIQSTGVRDPDGHLLVEVGSHADHWTELIGEYSTDSQVLVPLNNGGEEWTLEMRFEPLHGSIWHKVLFNPWVRLIGFVALVCGVMWYMYLGKVLDQLNPAQAVPGRVRSALDTLAEGLLVLDRKGRIVLCNVSLADLLDKHCDDLTGVPVDSLGWFGQEGDATSFPWERVLTTSVGALTHVSETLLMLDHRGVPRILKANCGPVMGTGEEVRGVVCSFEDITELESQKVELAISKAIAESANHAKSEFLANMSHEIRTPLNAILGFADVLRRGMFEDEEQRTEYLNTIHSSGRHLLHLTNDILDLSKVEAGRLEIETAACSPHQIILDVMNTLRVKTEEKQLFLSVSTPGGIPETIQSDSVRLRQIMTNVIGNAIKFTQDGGVSIVARTLEGTVPQMQIDITNTGVGISEDAQRRIFDPFSQADGTITRRFGGTGLGLTISKAFAEAMGGSLTVRSVEGQGSTFTIVISVGEIPRDMPMLDITQFKQMTQMAEPAACDVAFNFTDSRILLVDDGEANRQLIELVLKRNGLSVDTARNGLEAVELAGEFDYDLILMDMQMPVMGGYTATSTLREKGLEIPIVALTANAMRGDEEKCLSAGCTEFLTKPVDLDQLLGCLGDLLGAEPVHMALPPGQSESRSSYSNAAEVNEKDIPVAIRQEEEAQKQTESEVLAHSPTFEDETSTDSTPVDAPATPVLDSSHAGFHSVSQAELEEMLQGTSGGRQQSEQRTPAGISASCPSVADGRIRSSLPLDDPEFCEIVCGFVQKLRIEVAAMEQALHNDDIESVARLAHWLKGSAGTMGFGEFTEPGTRLMELARQGRVERIEPILRQIVAMTAAVDVPDLELSVELA